MVFDELPFSKLITFLRCRATYKSAYGHVLARKSVSIKILKQDFVSDHYVSSVYANTEETVDICCVSLSEVARKQNRTILKLAAKIHLHPTLDMNNCNEFEVLMTGLADIWSMSQPKSVLLHLNIADHNCLQRVFESIKKVCEILTISAKLKYQMRLASSPVLCENISSLRLDSLNIYIQSDAYKPPPQV